ncbi:ubiquitin conjugating enzyme E2 [Encephalitozoon hellem ATCC 50504]|uniref:Ubiquitin conjugating enzyme E2 n=1 Tax=Encephalitozoon hellem TaxID=27973 RepID=A0A9Q9C6N6_ENCHE|nr:ubiquitin conjugating enzyme E2 [Encephalitozoon hellem ATCC 50504]AFM97704.1 ubiquitin conjugating enzyme E2 [Encephalitozoon hellem ATCC 50504]UTX42395.1 ubiquitin conjugating enzyme E2 [Encephalitozoon hellem]WEL37837.1 ubiquitin conjugating enzyme E2 [Encephalitozoon hellem]|eukprot:XP_003886685.1 ubiquitin conjugating enzyme E2 [Encephalitozoon hellem ATCC 50504]
MPNLERLLAEQENLAKNRKYGFYAIPLPEKPGRNITRWECGVPGPHEGVYKGSYYTLYVDFPEDYPFQPPQVLFKYPVYHPNVYPTNQVCLDIIGDRWKPSLNVMNVLCGVQQLLGAPNTRSPANTDASLCFKKDPEKYMECVKENIRKYHRRPEWRGL